MMNMLVLYAIVMSGIAFFGILFNIMQGIGQKRQRAYWKRQKDITQQHLTAARAEHNETQLKYTRLIKLIGQQAEEGGYVSEVERDRANRDYMHSCQGPAYDGWRR